ncbi:MULTISPECIES: orc1/cdc6 family replication initiation protein [Haloarcula]|jgi:cell division control protein 6|uniref:ORC1-type DNA replication protein n=1 Tax=Haloarcula marismortui ATCC 33799 TaxID=662475 RepID=M0K019_9EURY|nr:MULTISPECIES: orc1/cdc6 family replication initiation protein [Haloarcula]EMA13210.1 cell division control protein 6 [Haloarcula californiae ATCC 33799]NHN66048.1 AAA family ATPase [Haloarcula sp. JP-Z28]RLM33178.1 AAA family ATPase [Haloarcula sp. Atlit-120R]
MGMFERDQQIFADATPLDDSYEPEDIRERDDELEKYQRALQPIIDNRPTSNIFLYGKTGTGKTVATKFMLSHLESDAVAYDDVELSTIWVSCENLSSSYQVAVALVNELRLGQGKDRISTTGYSQQRVFDLLYDELDSLGGTVVIVLDEIDNIGQSDDILYGLPRARSNDYVDGVRPVIVGISNDFQFRENLSPKVKDTLAEKEILFPPYDANQLRSILNPRAEKAFHDDVLENDVVPLCAAFAAQDTGSARQAIRLLREAGEIAQAEEAETVTGDFVRNAQDELEKNQLYEGMQELTTQGHAVLCALAYHQALDEVPIRSRDLYDRYIKICDRLDADSVSERRVRDHLSDMNMLGLISVYERNEGLSAGRYHEYELDVPLKAVLDVLLSTSRFEEVANIIQSTAEDNNMLQANLSNY